MRSRVGNLKSLGFMSGSSFLLVARPATAEEAVVPHKQTPQSYCNCSTQQEDAVLSLRSDLQLMCLLEINQRSCTCLNRLQKPDKLGDECCLHDAKQ